MIIYFDFNYSISDEPRILPIIIKLSFSDNFISSISSYIQCPGSMQNASLALKMYDKSMEPLISKNTYVYVALNIPLNHRDIGIFLYNNKIIIRRFLIRKNGLVLKPENNEYFDIKLLEKDNFTIIGKALGTGENGPIK